MQGCPPSPFLLSSDLEILGNATGQLQERKDTQTEKEKNKIALFTKKNVYIENTEESTKTPTRINKPIY